MNLRKFPIPSSAEMCSRYNMTLITSGSHARPSCIKQMSPNLRRLNSSLTNPPELHVWPPVARLRSVEWLTPRARWARYSRGCCPCHVVLNHNSNWTIVLEMLSFLFAIIVFLLSSNLYFVTYRGLYLYIVSVSYTHLDIIDCNNFHLVCGLLFVCIYIPLHFSYPTVLISCIVLVGVRLSLIHI